MRRLTTSAMGAALFAAVAAVMPAGGVAAQTVAIVGGRVHPATGAVIENGTVLVRDGRIVAVGANVAVPEGAQRIDATGKWVTPGFINPATTLGLVEIGAVADTRNAQARPGDDAVSAAFTVWDGLNPSTVLLAPARDEGVTSAVVLPGGGLVAGQGAVIDLVDGSTSDMLRRSPVAMVAQVDNPGAANTGAKGELMVRLRELLEDTRAYARRRADFERAATRPFAASRLDLEAMIPVAEGRLPLLVEADKASDIQNVLRLARDYRLKVVILGGAEAWMVARELAAARVPVLAGAMNNIPGSFATLGARQENPGLLRRAGVEVALLGTGADPASFNVRNIRVEAGNAVAYGMTWDDALRAVTVVPAQIFGVADRVGALRPGLDANVVVWSSDPFEFGSRAEHVLIRGRAQRLGASRQDELMKRYKTLPPDYGTP